MSEQGQLEERYVRHQGPMHGWFSLSYANYLVVPRTFIQEMPTEWQARLEKCLEEMHDTLEPINEDYRVTVVRDGKFAKPQWNNYRHGPFPEPR